MKQMLLALEKKINRNQELRMKYPSEPAKWVLAPTGVPVVHLVF